MVWIICKAGGALWSRPVQTKSGGVGTSKAIMSDSDLSKVLGSTNSMPTTMDNFNNFSMVQKIMAMEACMVRASLDLESNNSSADSDSVSSPTSSQPLGIYEDLDNYKFEFPAGYATNKRSTGCGVVYWNSLAGKSNMDCKATDAGGSTDNTDLWFQSFGLTGNDL